MEIYVVENLINNKKYVGLSSVSMEFRKKEHLAKVRGKSSKTYFHNALRKYGIDNFSWTVLCKCSSIEELNQMERHYIKELDTFWENNGYNLSPGGDGCGGLFGEVNGRYGMEVSEETRERISKGKSGTNIGDDNPSVKTAGSYRITYPDGHIEEVKNIRQWCRDKCLKHQSFYAICNGKRLTKYEGYWCERLEMSHQMKVVKGITESTVIKGKREKKERLGIK